MSVNSKHQGQGHGLSIKFLGVVWSSETEVIPEAVIDKVQGSPTPNTVAVFVSFGLLECVYPTFIGA